MGDQVAEKRKHGALCPYVRQLYRGARVGTPVATLPCQAQGAAWRELQYTCDLHGIFTNIFFQRSFETGHKRHQVFCKVE